MNIPAAEVFDDVFDDFDRKIVSLDFIHDLTPAQLEIFINASVAADGTTLPAGTIHLAQKDRDRLAALELAVILSGRSINIYPWQTGTPWVDMWMLSISKKFTFTQERKKMEVKRYTGTIWCPVVGNTSWVACRSGKVYVTGNT